METPHQIKRIEIVAAIVTILGAIWYFLRPKTDAVSAGTVVLPSGQPVAATPLVTPASTATTGGDGGAGGAGGTGGAGGAGGAGGTGKSVWDIFTPPDSGPFQLPAWLRSNLPPASDLPKRYMDVPEAPDSNAGCCGGKKAGCNNRGQSARFVDGQGSCVSSTTATLSQSQDRCSGGSAAAKAIQNMMSNVRYAGIESVSDVAPFLNDVYSLASGLPVSLDIFDPNLVATHRFGAS